MAAGYPRGVVGGLRLLVASPSAGQVLGDRLLPFLLGSLVGLLLYSLLAPFSGPNFHMCLGLNGLLATSKLNSAFLLLLGPVTCLQVAAP